MTHQPEHEPTKGSGSADSARQPPTLDIHFGENLEILRGLETDSFNLIYIDPPFNTGRTQERKRLRTVQDDKGDRDGFKGKRYRTIEIGSQAFGDSFDDYLAFLEPRLIEAHRLLSPTGSFFIHVDYREVHYIKVMLDGIFGRDSFINEIIWAYDYGARSTKKWPTKHDNILWYAMDPKSYTFRYDHMERIPYMAPGLVTPEKAARGKTPTDTWWHTIVSPNGNEKTGYPTQKPLGVLNRILQVHTNPGDRVLDFFAGSGTTGEAAVRHGCSAVLIDNNEQAIEVMVKRLAFAKPCMHGWGE
ncbi:MAG: site-specific DNA-methyltransferase [Planctomycetes bacterium]|nr:site-specific DNA-methyltransferase [Planctomycetota bacterium]NOG55806.1 site-specific DNA-methyltransferase [Planctomycetota bacterium]